jgi:hypothetical protein
VTALHSHMLVEKHDASKLARGLHAALGRMQVKAPAS